ncbi:MAG TPA: glycosyltransferase family 2 protein [Solirubrobacteraceae bacterium]|nr:glycosyltransferase family 2 protein [Solirubrobacteraceae bacterium]
MRSAEPPRGATESDPLTADASVIVCAFSVRRMEQTVECVTAVLSQRPAPEEVIVVVDHNHSLEDELRARLPDAVRIVASHGPTGLSSARNTAVGMSRHNVIVFIDDDALPRPGWLTGLLAAFDNPRVAGAGGHAVARWERAQPAWFPDEFLWVVGCSYRGQPASGPVRNPLGCNMAFRAAAFERVGLFDPAIGRIGTRPLGCEETEFCVRIAAEPEAPDISLVPAATVEHRVPQERGTFGYLLRRCFYEGISKALVRRLGDVRSLDTERAYVRSALAGSVARSLRAAARGPDRASALGRGSAVIGGLVAAATGYVVGGAYYRLHPPAASAPKLHRPAPAR